MKLGCKPHFFVAHFTCSIFMGKLRCTILLIMLDYALYYQFALSLLLFGAQELSSVEEDPVVYASAFAPELCWLW